MTLQLVSEPITTYDVAEALKGKEGSFVVERAGQKNFVTCVSGHSIASWTPFGEVTPTLVQGNPPYTITPITALVDNASRILGGGGLRMLEEGQRRSGD